MKSSKLETFPSSTAPNRPHILAPGRILWGVLEDLQPMGDGLVLVRVAGLERLVDESLRQTLQGLMGQTVAIGHIRCLDGRLRWGAGGLGA